MNQTTLLTQVRENKRRFESLCHRLQEAQFRYVHLCEELWPGRSGYTRLRGLPMYSFATSMTGTRRIVRRPRIAGGARQPVTLVPVTFRFSARLAPTARTISVIGSFNGWNTTVHPLRRAENGNWTITVYLTPGRAVYLFSVDGIVWLDPEDDGRVPNIWGSEYSVRHVTSEPVAVTAANNVAE